MKKIDAINIFNDTKGLADALGISRQAIYQWPDKLTQDQVDRIIGAAVRLGKKLPDLVCENKEVAA